MLKKIITGALFYEHELDTDFVDDLMNDPKKLGHNIELFQLDPYGSHILPNYILGIVEQNLEGKATEHRKWIKMCLKKLR